METWKDRLLKAVKGTNAKLLLAGLAAALLLAVGATVGYAFGQTASPQGGFSTGNGRTASATSGSGLDSMMGSGGMDQMMNGDQMQTMGSFDKDKTFDLQFLDQMTMHHDGAIMSSKHMISDSKRPELQELAQNIEKSQLEQVDQMQEWRDEWYPDVEQAPAMPAGMMDAGMTEHMMGGSMQEMMGGAATDEMFLRMMIPHHQMAVDMSQKALERSEHPELKELARKIIDEQTAEIKLMEGYLEEIEGAEKG